LKESLGKELSYKRGLAEGFKLFSRNKTEVLTCKRNLRFSFKRDEEYLSIHGKISRPKVLTGNPLKSGEL